MDPLRYSFLAHAINTLVASLFLASIPLISMAQSNQDAPIQKRKPFRPKTEDPQVQQWIADLSDKSFAQRQFAAESLWQQGKAIRPALQAARAAAEPEVARRIDSILKIVDITGDSKLPPGMARMLILFHDGELDVKSQILRNLLSRSRYRLVFQLLEKLDDRSQQTLLFRENLNLSGLIVDLGRTGRWEEVDFIVSHPLTWRHHPALSVYYSQLHGSLDETIDQLRRQVAGKSTDHAARRKLVSLLRVSGDTAGALEQVRRLPDSADKFDLINNLLMEQDRWDLIQPKLIQPERLDPLQVQDRLPATEGQRAFVQHLEGNWDAADQIIHSIVSPKASADDANAPDSDVDEETLASANQAIDAYMACLNWQPAHELMKSLKLTDQIFDLATGLQRLDLAYQIKGMTDDVDMRIERARSAARLLRSRIKKSQRLADADSSNRANQAYQSAMQLASLSGSLGRTSEAKLMYRLIGEAIAEDEDDSFNRRGQIVISLIDLGAYDEVWQMLAESFEEKEYWYLTEELFDNRSKTADFWYNQLKSRYPDMLERLNAIAHLVDSPLARDDLPVDVNELMGAVDDSVEADKNQDEPGIINYFLAMTRFYQGQLKLFESHLRRSASLGQIQAIEEMGLTAQVNQQWEQAAELFDQVWKENGQAHSAMQAAVAYENSGQTEAARRRKLVAMACWQDSYRIDMMRDNFRRLQMQSTLAELLTAIIYTSSFNGSALDHYRSALAEAVTKSDPQWAATNLKITMFLRLGATTRSASQLGLAFQAIQIQLAQARAQIRQGNIDSAVELLGQINAFRPGEVDICEQAIPEMDAAGYVDQADQLFTQVTDFYIDLLKTHPNSPLHNNNYAWSCACAARRLNYAREHARKAVRWNEHNSNYLDTLAELEFLLGDPQKAAELSLRCLKINPKMNYRRQYHKFRGH